MKQPAKSLSDKLAEPLPSKRLARPGDRPQRLCLRHERFALLDSDLSLPKHLPINVTQQLEDESSLFCAARSFLSPSRRRRTRLCIGPDARLVLLRLLPTLQH